MTTYDVLWANIVFSMGHPIFLYFHLTVQFQVRQLYWVHLPFISFHSVLLKSLNRNCSFIYSFCVWKILSCHQLIFRVCWWLKVTMNWSKYSIVFKLIMQTVGQMKGTISAVTKVSCASCPQYHCHIWNSSLDWNIKNYYFWLNRFFRVLNCSEASE